MALMEWFLSPALVKLHVVATTRSMSQTLGLTSCSKPSVHLTKIRNKISEKKMKRNFFEHQILPQTQGSPPGGAPWAATVHALRVTAAAERHRATGFQVKCQVQVRQGTGLTSVTRVRDQLGLLLGWLSITSGLLVVNIG